MQTQEERQLVRFVKFMTFLLIVLIIIEMVRCSRVNASVVAAEIGTNRWCKKITVKSQGFKSYTKYTAITRKTSKQYKLQKEYAYTGEYGIRMVNERFCIAVGTGVTKQMGQYVDVVLENGTVIPCIVADQKADEHTKADRITTAHNKCVCEFYLGYVLPDIKYHGDVSYACEEWKSPVCEFRVYATNVFN
jgi:hypothetical protein